MESTYISDVGITGHSYPLESSLNQHCTWQHYLAELLIWKNSTKKTSEQQRTLLQRHIIWNNTKQVQILKDFVTESLLFC